MVDVPSIANVVPQLRAPTPGVSPGQIAQPYQEMAANLDKASGKLNEAAVEMAKTAGLKAVTRDADGNIQIDAPPLVGDAAIAFHQAVKVAAVADGEGVLKRDDIALRTEHRDDPDGYVKAAEAYKREKIQQYTDAAGADVGITLGKIIDGQTTLTYRGLLNEHEKLEMQRADASMTVGMTSATDDLSALARGGVSSGPAWDAAWDKYNTLQKQRMDNPRLSYPPEQAAFEKEQLISTLKGNGILNHVDQTYKNPDSEKGGYRAALAEAEAIRTDTSLKLSDAQREGFYHKAVGEIRANEAIRRQDIGEARAAFRELSTASQLGQRIDPSEVEQVRQAYRAAGYPAGIAMVDAAFAHKDLHDDFGKRPLADQTGELNTIRGAAAAKQAYQFFRGRGYRDEEAAGIVGNLAHESGLNPFASGDSGTSGGLAQFHNERLTALRTYAASVGKPATDFQTQLEFIDKELNSTEAGTRAKLAGARSPEEAAAAFIHYERPAGYTPDNPAGGLGYQNRQSLARSVFAGGAGDKSSGPGVSSWLIANRAAAVDDAATKAWKEVWTDWSAGKGGRPPSGKIDDILNAARATGNIDLQAKIAHEADLMDRVERMSQLPLPQQQALTTELQRRLRQGETDTGTAIVEKQLAARSAAITKGLDDNPISTTVANFGDKMKSPGPLDWSSDQSAALGLRTRAQIAQFGAQNWQVSPRTALDAPEVAQVQSMLANPDPAVKGRVFNALSALPEDVRNATLAKIGSGRPDLMVSVAAGSMMKAAPDVAASIIRGQAAIKIDKGYLPEKGSEATAFDQEFDKHVPASTFSLAARTDASGPYAVAQGMVKARYADLSAQAADTTGKLDKDRLTQSVNDVTGGILDHNGGKLIAPARGMPQATFDKVMYGLTDADLGHDVMPSNLGAANAALNLTPQEQALYQRHLTNLTGTGGVTNANGSRSTLYQSSVEHDGKTYNIPTVWDGKILPIGEAVKRVQAEGWDKFPAYANSDQAEARYQKMHDFMDKDTGQYFKGSPAAVTTLNGEAISANYLRNSGTLESVGDGRYYVKLGKDPMRPVYAYQGANTESPQKFMLDLRNRPLGVAPTNTAFLP